MVTMNGSMVNAMKFWAAALLSSVLVAMLFPPFHGNSFAWVALIPLLWSCYQLKGERLLRKSFTLAWSAGLLSNVIQFFWLTTVTSLGAWVLAAYLALFWGLFGMLAALAAKRFDYGVKGWQNLVLAFSLASVWAGLEVFRGWFLTGFGWNPLGVAFHDVLVIAQAADLLGVSGLSWLLIFFQVIVLGVAFRAFRSLKSQSVWAMERWDVGLTACLIVGCICYGVTRISQWKKEAGFDVKSLLVQLNVPQDLGQVLWGADEIHRGYEDETLNAIEKNRESSLKQMQEALKQGGRLKLDLQSPDWVIWPEVSLVGRMLSTPEGEWGMWEENRNSLQRVQQAGKFDVIFGIGESDGMIQGEQMLEKPNGNSYNSMAFYGPDQEMKWYRKHHLVIFGETIPLIDRLPWLKAIFEQQAGFEYGGSFLPGTRMDPIPMKVGSHSLSVVPSICFEDTVPRLMRKLTRDEPQVIVNVTNDGWFKQSGAAQQHFANAKFRAIELRRPMFRCANSGISAALDGCGSSFHSSGKNQMILDEKGSHFTRASMLCEVKVPHRSWTSWYLQIGDWGIYVLSMLGLVAILIKRRAPL